MLQNRENSELAKATFFFSFFLFCPGWQWIVIKGKLSQIYFLLLLVSFSWKWGLLQVFAQSTRKLAGASRSSVPLALKEWRKFNQLTFINETAVCARIALQMFLQHTIAQCVLCKVYFSAQTNKLRPILKFEKYYSIEHIFVPACSSARKIHFFKF